MRGKRLLSVVLVVVLLLGAFVQADANPIILGMALEEAILAGTVIVAGAIMIAQKWRDSEVKDTAKTTASNTLNGNTTSLAYDRGTGVPSNERYVSVPLTKTKDAVEGYLSTKGSVSGTPASGWATGVTDSILSPDNCYYGQQYPCREYRNAVPANSMACAWTLTNPDGSLTTPVRYASTADRVIYYAGGKKTWVELLQGCNQDQKNAYRTSTLGDMAASDRKTWGAMEAIGKDLSTGTPTVGSSAPANSKVIPVVGNGDVKETTQSSDLSDFFASSNASSAGSGAYSGPSASDIGVAVGAAVPTAGQIGAAVGAAVPTAGQIGSAVAEGMNNSVATPNVATPSVNTYDSSVSTPASQSITTRIGSFIANNPLVGIISGSGIQTSNLQCSMAQQFDFMGHSIPFNFSICEYQTAFDSFGVLLLSLSTLGALMYLFRRGE